MADEPKPGAKPPTAPGAPPAPKGPPQAATAPWESDLTRLLRERFGDQIIEFTSQLGQEFLIAGPEAAIPILDFLKMEADFDYLVDVTAVD